MNCCFNGTEGRIFCIVSSLVIKDKYIMIILAQKLWYKPGQPSISSVKPNIYRSNVLLCIWWHHKLVAYYELVKSGESVTVGCYQQRSSAKTRIKRKTIRISQKTRQSFSNTTTLGHMSLNRSRKRYSCSDEMF